MNIKKISIKNFRLFNNTCEFIINNLNVPNGSDLGSGLNIFVGENGCGKTSLLDAVTLPILNYKAESITLDDFNSKDNDIHIKIFSDNDFNYDGTMPRSIHRGQGFEFEAKFRTREAHAYLSSLVVSDQRFIRADGETRPEDGKPDLRLKVDNPWKGSRFSENDIIYLDKNRTSQVKGGTYNTTRFDRLMEDYSYQYIKANKTINDLDKEVVDKILTSESPYLQEALDKFAEIYGESIRLSAIDNYQPFKKAFFSLLKSDNHQIPLSNIGSGYEMMFSILYAYCLSKQSGKTLILIIDEPELHMHPSLQETFANLLLEISTNAQIFIATHSPLLLKQILSSGSAPVIKILLNESGIIRQSDIEEKRLSYLSANEINYIAFQLPTEEYHNELYEELKGVHGANMRIVEFDITYFQGDKNETPSYPNFGVDNKVSLHTYVRNQIHHRSTSGKVDTIDLKKSIETMRRYLATTRIPEDESL